MLTFVPVPQSKAKGDPLYGDHLLQMLTALWPDRATDIGELVVQAASTEAVHDSDIRPTPVGHSQGSEKSLGGEYGSFGTVRHASQIEHDHKGGCPPCGPTSRRTSAHQEWP